MHSNRGFRRLVEILSYCFTLQQILLCFPAAVQANPQGGQVVAGQATIAPPQGSNLTVNQTSDRAIINWQGFSIGTGETTRFVQPSAASAVLNRVTGFGASRLDGSLTADGQVFLINPNGVVIGPSGRIETNGFVASTLDVSDNAFMNGGDLDFAGDSAAHVRNLGVIKAETGDIVLAARTVENAGTLQAPGGVAALAAGNEVLYRPAGAERLFVKSAIPLPAAADGVTNTGTIEAARAELAAAGGNVYTLAVNNGGAIHATGVSLEDGRVVLTSQGGNIATSGTITAVKANGEGGQIRLQAEGEGPSAVTVSGTLAAAGIAPGAVGGSVTVTGKTLTLTGTAKVDASGDAGGGLIRIGGDTRGENPDIYNATSTLIEAGAEIRADALTAGDGGRVVVWADEITRFAGRIQARGGADSGDGGFAEVSGQALDFQGLADLTAPAGLWGTLLLDPGIVTISGLYADGTVDGIQYINPGTLSANLNATGQVIIDATNSINFESGTVGWTSNAKLTLNSGVGIYFYPVEEAVGIYSPLPKIIGVNGELTLTAKRITIDPLATISANKLTVFPLYDDAVTSLGGFRFSGPVTLGTGLQIIGRSGNTCSNPANCVFKVDNPGNSIPKILIGDGTGQQPAFGVQVQYLPGTFDLVNGLSSNLSVETSGWTAFEGDLTVRSLTDLTLVNHLLFRPDVSGEELVLSAGGRFINSGTPISWNRGAGIDPLVSQFPFVSRMLVFSYTPVNDSLGASDWWWNPTEYGDPAMQGRIYNKTYAGLATVPGGNWFVYGYQPEVILTPLGDSRQYGDTTDLAALWTASALMPGDSATGSPTVSTEATQQSSVGEYDVTLSGIGTYAVCPGYKYTLNNAAPGKLSVTQRDLYVYPQDVTRLYGEDNPSLFPAIYVGLMDWDKSPTGAPLPGVIASGLRLYGSTSLFGGAEVTRQTGVGNYYVLKDAAGFSSTNYRYQSSFDSAYARLKIDPAPLTVTANNLIRRIGDPNPDYSVSYTGLMAWDDPNDPNVLVCCGFNTPPTADAAPGNYPITPSGGWAANYTLSYVDGTFTVKEPYQLVITVNDTTKVYGNPNPVFSYRYDGFEDGDTADKVSGVQAATAAGDRSPVGVYLVTPSAGSFPAYYTPIYVDGRLQVTPRTLTLHATDTTVQYGSVPNLGYTTDLLAGDSLSSEPLLSASGRNVGNYTISLTGGAAANYTVVRQDGTLTITSAPLWVRADDAQIYTGQGYPAFTASVTGLKYDDTASVLQGLNLVTDPAGPVAAQDKSTQAILQSGALTAANYAPIDFTAGVLTILPQQVIIIGEPIILDKVEIVSGSVNNGGSDISWPTGWQARFLPPPFGVPEEGALALRYVAMNVIRQLGLNVTNVNAWMMDPANRALMLPALFEFLKAPLSPGSTLYAQREVIKNALETQIRIMQVEIAERAVQMYNDWRATNRSYKTRLEMAYFGDMDVPTEDFSVKATLDYLTAKGVMGTLDSSTDPNAAAYTMGAVSMTALASLGISFAVASSMGLVLPMSGSVTVSAAGVASSALGAVSAAGAAAGVVAGVVFAVAGTIMGALRYSDYKAVEDKYANLVNSARNYDIDAALNGDANTQGALFLLMACTGLGAW